MNDKPNTVYMDHSYGGPHNLEPFRVIDSNDIIVDSYGEKWKRITSMGWFRNSDGFFWPGDPTNSNNMMNSLPPTVSHVKQIRGNSVYLG